MTKKNQKKKWGGRKHTKKGGKFNKLSKKDNKSMSLSRKEKKALRKKRHNISESSHKIQKAILCDCVGINPYDCKKDHGFKHTLVWCCRTKYKHSL